MLWEKSLLVEDGWGPLYPGCLVLLQDLGDLQVLLHPVDFQCASVIPLL